MKLLKFIVTLSFMIITALLKVNIAWSLANSPWLTYHNSTCGFTFQYPANLSIQKTFNSYYFLSDKWRSFNDDPENMSDTGKAILSVPIIHIKNKKSYPMYYAAELRIGASSNNKDVMNCIKNSQSTTVINGTTFYVFPLDDEGMMQYLHGISYRVIHNNQCFAIEQIETGSKMYVGDDKPNAKHISDAVLKKYYEQANDIIQTFRFIK
jgi:hypothetical protein